MSFFTLVAFASPAICIILIVKYVVEYFVKRRSLNKLAGPPDIPFIGNVHQLPLDPSDLRRQLHDWAIEYGNLGHKTARFWIGTFPYVLPFRAQDVETILHSSKHSSKSDIYQYVHNWLGFGLLTSSGQKWKSRRRLLTPSFHFNILKDYISIYNEQARVFLSKLEAEGSSPRDVFQLVTRCTLDIICETAMGVKMETQSLKNVNYIDAVHSLSAIAQWRQRTLWLLSHFLYPLLPIARREAAGLKLVKDFTRRVIDARREEMRDRGDEDEDVTETKTKKYSSFLTTLIQCQMDDANMIDDDGIQEEVDTFMFEGHDTTSSGITWAILCIGSHPHVQKKLHDEMDEIFGDSDRDVTDEDLKRMTYLSQVLKEVMRLCPPVPFIGRTLSEDAELDGKLIEEGTNVVVSIYSLHRDPDQFPDPESFNPDRFLPENADKRHPYAYVPFSAGPRNCIGQKFAQMEEKVVLSWMLRRFHWEALQSFEDLRPTVELILRPSLNFGIKLNLRT